VRTPLVSVVIPTRNGAATLPSLLNMLGRQRTEFQFEVVAIDSGSTDGTVELLQSKVDELIQIPSAAFNHGATRNLGVERARGALIVLMVQDAVPHSEDWLAVLTAPLLADPGLAGTFARQQPRPGASEVTRHYLSRALAASASARRLHIASHRSYESLDPMARLIACTFDNVCSCVRKSVWEDHRFKATPIAEDVEWARDVLLAGHRLIYVPEAVVIHSHDRPARYEFDRTRALHRRLYELFGLRTIPSVSSLARSIGSSLVLHWRLEKTPRAVALAVAWPLGQYLGARSAVRGSTVRQSRAV
jgi:rhamnosyltransferase